MFEAYGTGTKLSRQEAHSLAALAGRDCPFNRWPGQEEEDSVQAQYDQAAEYYKRKYGPERLVMSWKNQGSISIYWVI